MALEYTSPEELMAAQVGRPIQSATPATPAAPVIAERQGVPKELANDLMFITRLTSPTGDVVRAAPNDIDGLIAAGYKPVNLEKTWEISNQPGTAPIKVRGGDLQSYIQQGYRTNKAEEYIQQRAEYQKAIAPKQTDLSFLEGAGGMVSAAASGATFGLTDVAARGLNELIEAVGLADDGYAKDQANQLREIRDALGWGSTVAEVLGGLLTGGVIASAGKKAATKVGLGVLEGLAGGVGNQASRQAMEDPNITVESYLASAALGGGLGAVGGAISAGLGRRLSTEVAQSTLPYQKIQLGDLTQFADSRQAARGVVSLKDEAGELIGTATLSRADPSSYHAGGRHGVVIEGLQLADNAPKTTGPNLIRELTEQFGAVSSPSRLDALKGEMRDLFASYGVKHTTKSGDDWFQATSATLPQATDQDSFAFGIYRKIMDLMGKTPEKGTREYELVKKLTDPDKGILRKEVIEMIDDPTKKIHTVMRDFAEIDDVVKTYARTADEALKGLAERITPEAAMNMKKGVALAQDAIVNSMDKLDTMGTGSGRYYSKMLSSKFDGLEKVIKTESPQQAWLNLGLQRREMLDTIKSLSKKGKIPDEALQELNGVVAKMDEALEAGFGAPVARRPSTVVSPVAAVTEDAPARAGRNRVVLERRVTGVGQEPPKFNSAGEVSEKWKAWKERASSTEPQQARPQAAQAEQAIEEVAQVADEGLTESAQLYKRLLQYSEEMVDANNAFGRRFRSNGVISPENVFEAYQSTKPGKMASKLDTLDRFRASMTTFRDTLKEARAKGVLKSAPLPSERDFSTPLNNVLKMRELSETAALLNRLGTGTGPQALVQSMAATVGGTLGAGLGNATGVPFAGIGLSIAGSSAGSTFASKLTNPTALLRMSMSTDRITNKLDRIVTKMSNATATVTKKISRPGVLLALGANRMQEDTPKDYVTQARERLIELQQPEVMEITINALPEEAKAVAAQKMANIYTYALSNMPSPSPRGGVSQADALKTDKILLAAVNPVAALERALINNETDVLKHVAAMYPALVESFQMKLSDKSDEIAKMPYNKRLTLQRISGMNVTGSSLGAGQLSQGVFAARREEQTKGGGITPPPSTPTGEMSV